MLFLLILSVPLVKLWLVFRSSQVGLATVNVTRMAEHFTDLRSSVHHDFRLTSGDGNFP